MKLLRYLYFFRLQLLFLVFCNGCQYMSDEKVVNIDKKESVELTQEIARKCLSDIYPKTKVEFDVKDFKLTQYYSKDDRFVVYAKRRSYTYWPSLNDPSFFHEGEFQYIDGKWKAVIVEIIQESRK